MAFDLPSDATLDPEFDEHWMRHAIKLAHLAAEVGEVPVGAVVVHDGKLISGAFNLRERQRDPVAHAELLALQRAAAVLGRWRLSQTSIYVTLEPCAMCAGAMVNARVDRVVYGAADAKAGAVESVFEVLSSDRLNHRVDALGGILAHECAALLSDFFQGRRKPKR